MRVEAIEKNIQNPLASFSVGTDTGRMKDFGSEIAAEEAPEWAVRSAVDVVLVARDDLGHG